MSLKSSQPDTRVDAISKANSTTSNDLRSSKTFHFWNGDTYTGPFALSKDKTKIARQGKGVYNTGDGETYEGVWENDYLKGNCKITFPDQMVFAGSLTDMMIQGHAKFLFRDNVQIEADFCDNKVIGNIYLKDPNNNLWKGTLSDDGDYITFRPLHPFWQAVSNIPSQHTQIYYEEFAEENESIWGSIY